MQIKTFKHGLSLQSQFKRIEQCGIRYTLQCFLVYFYVGFITAFYIHLTVMNFYTVEKLTVVLVVV